MGGPPFLKNKSQLFSILACHAHTSQRLSILFSENVTPLSVRTSFVSDLDQQCPQVSVWACQCHTSQRLEPFCELEPGQHDTYIYTYISIVITGVKNGSPDMIPVAFERKFNEKFDEIPPRIYRPHILDFF